MSGDVEHVDWLHRLAHEDDQSLPEAATMVATCVQVGAQDWSALSTKSRAALYVATRVIRSRSLSESGQDVAAAVSLADLDGGVSAAQLAAKAAGAAVVEALRSRNRG